MIWAFDVTLNNATFGQFNTAVWAAIHQGRDAVFAAK
jgi:hypothetical protein